MWPYNFKMHENIMLLLIGCQTMNIFGQRRMTIEEMRFGGHNWCTKTWGQIHGALNGTIIGRIATKAMKLLRIL